MARDEAMGPVYTDVDAAYIDMGRTTKVYVDHVASPGTKAIFHESSHEFACEYKHHVHIRDMTDILDTTTIYTGLVEELELTVNNSLTPICAGYLAPGKA